MHFFYTFFFFSNFNTHLHVRHRFNFICVSVGGVWCRWHTWTSHWVKGVSQRHSTVVRVDLLIQGTNACCITIWRTLSSVGCSLFIYFFYFFVQFLDSPGRFAVLSSRFEAKLFSNDSTPPGPEHHGLSAVALGAQQCHDYQPGPRHQEQPLYSSSAGTQKVQVQMHIERRYVLYTATCYQ